MAGENKVERSTGAAAIAMSLTPPTTALYLACVKLALSAVGGAAEDFTITINSATNSAYDTVVFRQDMNTIEDLVWCPDQPVVVVNTDVIDFAYANSNTRTYGLEVIYRNA